MKDNFFTLYPAIDIKDGKCVRLLFGEMEKETVTEELKTLQKQDTLSRANKSPSSGGEKDKEETVDYMIPDL